MMLSPPPKQDGWLNGSNGAHTPKRGSWLDMAESELGVLSSQRLDRRISNKQTLIDEIAAWDDDRNANHANAAAADARIKLKPSYPSIRLKSSR